ncbi:MAG: orotidine-5'-phosphate decarboxylase [Propionibacteriaceae bacterium]|jgi:orotidine-5'-phosphate decarboxylase|nr:orotidine-5'-phosphate decarboxylase [Propionibacteriaceae bacterium]
MNTWMERLNRRTGALGSLCVGIDPHVGLLQAWGLPVSLDGLRRFADRTVTALADQVACFKPQVAFFERWGSQGMAVLEETLANLRQAGALVIADAKRGDIGSTMQAYADAWLGEGPLACDALTVSPYLGIGALQPAIDLAAAKQRGLFVLARTSNPEGTAIQLAWTSDGRSVAQTMVDAAGQINHDLGTPVMGLVVGGTRADVGVDLTDFQGTVLIPGIGAQGGTMSGLRSSFAGTKAKLLPSVSREVLAAGPAAASLRASVARLLAS